MRKLSAFIVTAALVALGLMFSVVLIGLLAAAGLIAGAYFWWKTRALRKLMREQTAQNVEGGEFREEALKGEVIEGEVIRKVVTIEKIER